MKKVLLYTVIGAVIMFSVVFGYLQISIANSNRNVKENLAEAKRIYDAIPVWHKKLQTQQDIKIGVITDTHVHPNRIDKTNKADDAPRYLNEKYIKVLDKFASQMNEFQPEFIVHLGDVIEGTNDEAFVGMQGLELVEEEMQKINIPLHWAIGNHDLRSVTREQFKETLKLDSINQSFDVMIIDLLFSMQIIMWKIYHAHQKEILTFVEIYHHKKLNGLKSS